MRDPERGPFFCPPLPAEAWYNVGMRRLLTLLLFSCLAAGVTSCGKGLSGGGGSDPDPGGGLGGGEGAAALDSSFGNNGTVLTDFGGNDVINAVALQSDGKIVVTGNLSSSADTKLFIARYLSTGVLDSSFATAGKFVAGLSGGSQEGNALALHPDGSIVALGTHTNGTISRLLVVKCDANGTADPTFDSDGILIPPATFSTHGTAVTLTENTLPEIIAVGTVGSSGSDEDFYIGRISEVGVLMGEASLPIGGPVDVATSVAKSSAGRVFIGGYTQTGSSSGEEMVVAAVMVGSLSFDTSYGDAGKLIVGVAGADRVNQLLNTDGLLYLAGYTSGSSSDTRHTLARISDEIIDLGFGDAGFALLGTEGGLSEATGLAADSSGRIYTAGTVPFLGVSETAVARYLSSGELDTSFHNTGTVVLSLGSVSERAEDMAIDADGNIIVVGSAQSGPDRDSFLLRVRP